MINGIPETMQAVCLGENDLLTLRTVPVPVPSKGEVLVKIACAPINPSDLARIKNLSAHEKKSFIAGIEGSGTVISGGRGFLPALWKGKRVSCSSVHSSSGTWAQFMITRAAACVPLPSTINDEQGSMMLVNPLTAAAFISMAKSGNHSAIINTAASSALGRMIEWLAVQNNVPLIQVVKNESHRDSLLSRGASYVIDSSKDRYEVELHSLAKKLKATLAFDAIGGESTRKLFLSMPFGSTIVVYGNLSGEQPLVDHRALIGDNIKLSGFYLVNWLRENSMITTLKSIRIARNMLNGPIAIPVRERFGLADVQKAIDTYLQGMSKGKVILVP